MRDYLWCAPKWKPDTNAPHKEEARMQAIRDAIRSLAGQLPENEATTHTEFLNSSEAELQQQKDLVLARDVVKPFNWNGLPNEIKNMIYRKVMVQEEPIQPHVYYPNDPRRRVRKYNLGANLLRTSKSMYKESLPILLGANTFEINGYFWNYLGTTMKSRNERGKFIRSVIIQATPNRIEWRSLNKITNLEECTVVSDYEGMRRLEYAHERYNESNLLLRCPPRREMEQQAKIQFELPGHAQLHDFIADNPGTKFHYLQEHQVKPVAPLLHEIGAVRLNVAYDGHDGTDQDSVHRFRYEGGHKINFYKYLEPRNFPSV